MPASGATIPMIVQVGCIAMHQLGANITEISEASGIARSTVRAIIENPDIQSKYSTSEFTNRLKKSFPDRIFAKANALLESLNLNDPKLTEYQKVGMFGILFDKYRIASGQATSIIDYNETVGSIKDIDAKIIELEGKLRLDAPTKKITKT